MPPYPIRTERDVPFLSWDDASPASWCTVESQAAAATYLMRSSGLVHADYASMLIRGTADPQANEINSAGIHIQGPVPGEELTQYAYNVVASSQDPNTYPVLYVAISPATPTSGAGGDIVSIPHLLEVPSTRDAGGQLNASGIIALPITDYHAADRAIAFGVGCVAGLTASSGANSCFAVLSVRRLVGTLPLIYDKYKT